MTTLTEGQKAFQANIVAMQKLGRENAERREREAEQNTVNHLAVMTARAEDAANARERRRLEGVARRDAHNAQLRKERAERLERNERIKTVKLRAA